MGIFDSFSQIPGLGANTFGSMPLLPQAPQPPAPAPPPPVFQPMQQPVVNDHSTRNRWLSLLMGGAPGLARQIMVQDAGKAQQAAFQRQAQVNGQALLDAEDPQTHRIDANRYRDALLKRGIVPDTDTLKTFDTMDYQRAKLLSEQMIAGAPKVVPKDGRLYGNNPVTGAPVDISPAPAPYTLSTDQVRLNGDNQVVATGTPSHFDHDPTKDLYLSNPGGVAGPAADPNAPPPPPGQAHGKGFEDYFNKILLPSEGGYNPHDANGAPVNMGVNQAANPDVDVKNLTKDGARTIAHDRYWAVSGADKLPDDLAPIHADTAYVFGPGAAQKMLAQAHADPKTYLELRQARFEQLAKNNPADAKYLKAWTNRNKRLADYVGLNDNGQSSAGPAPSPTAGAPRLVKAGVPKAEDDAPLTPETTDYIAQQYVMTGQIPPLGMGKVGAKNRADVLNRAAAIERETGATGADAVSRHIQIKATTQALNQNQKMKSNVQQFENTALKNADLVLQLAPKGAGPLNSPWLNKWVQTGRKAVQGDPNVTQFDIALGTFLDEYAKITSGSMGNQGSTDSARHEAYSRLNKFASQGQIAAGIQTMKAEMHNRSLSLDEEEARLRGQISGAAPGKAAGPAAHPAANAPKVLRWNPKKGDFE